MEESKFRSSLRLPNVDILTVCLCDLLIFIHYKLQTFKRNASFQLQSALFNEMASHTNTIT